VSNDPMRNEILSVGPDDDDWGDVLGRVKRAHYRRQVYTVAALTALVIVGAASAYALSHRGQPWCKAPTNDAWKKVLASHVVALSRHVSVWPIAIADSHSFYAYVYSKSYSGIAKVDAVTSRYERILRDRYGGPGSSDGRWFVWADQIDGYGTTRAIWAWNSRSRRLRRISGSMRSGDGKWWVNATTPEVRDGLATWSQSAHDGQQSEVHVVDLLTGRNRVISQGSAYQPFLLSGHIVMWTEDVRARGSKDPTFVLRAANATTGRRVQLPKTLRNLPSRGADTLVSDGEGFVYSAGPRESLWWSPSLEIVAWHVFSLKKVGDWIENPLELAERYVLFGAQTGVGNASFLVDVKTGGYLEIDRVFPGPISKDAVTFGAQTTIKSSHPIDAIYFIPLKALPTIHACSKPATATG
jgi:hypothetical protein